MDNYFFNSIKKDDNKNLNDTNDITRMAYSSFTVNSSTTACADTGLIVATSADTGKYPTFTYNIATGEKTCSATTTASQKLGCSSSKW